MKYRRDILLLAFLICSSIIYITSGYYKEQNEDRVENINIPQNPDMLSELFPLRNQTYPNYDPQTIRSQSLSNSGEQFIARMHLIEHYRHDLMSRFSPNILPENIGIVCLPIQEIKTCHRFPETQWKYITSFLYEDINITVVYVPDAVAVTFEYNENPTTPEKLESIYHKLSLLLPVMDRLVFSYDIQENQGIYLGEDCDETKLYYVKEKKEKIFDEGWIKNIRWWRGHGRFGISFDCYPKEYSPTQMQFIRPNLYQSSLL